MLYLQTLQAVTPHELQAVGYRAQDLAFLSQNQLVTAQSFVVLSQAFDETIRQNSLKYKIDYILTHVQENIPSTIANAYNGIRKAMLEAKLPNGLDTELRETYESITTPATVGELVAANDRAPVRIVLSMNRFDDPENNDGIIQNINNFEELLVAVREAWALSYHPSHLRARMKERFPESKFKVALLVQTMARPTSSTHIYSCLPQDHHKLYAQTYNGNLDLREKIAKDYYAIAKSNLGIVATQLRPQTISLERNDAKELVPTPLPQKQELIQRELLELARLTKKAERLLGTPIKAFFASYDGGQDYHELLWVNRLGFDILVKENEPEPTPIVPATIKAEEPAIALQPADDFLIETTVETVQTPAPQASTPVDVQHGVAAKLLNSSLRIVHQIVERKYRGAFGETPMPANLAEMLNRLNQSSTFSRSVDGALLLQAEEAAKNESTISETEYAKAIEEVAFLMTYA